MDAWPTVRAFERALCWRQQKQLTRNFACVLFYFVIPSKVEESHYLKSRAAIALTLSFFAAATVHAERISLVGATVINPAEGKVLPNATVVINGDRIERVSVGKQDAAALGKQIDCAGKFILPGYIDTHIHFFQSADLFTRPDVADLNNVRLYKDEVAWIKS